jgi:hypothetical protein
MTVWSPWWWVSLIRSARSSALSSDNKAVLKRSKQAKGPAKQQDTPHDFTVVARRVVEQAIGEKLDGTPLNDPNAPKNPHHSGDG